MNRYVAAGIAKDAQAGLRVLVVAHSGRGARETCAEIARLSEGDFSVRRANGDERINHANGGWVRFTHRWSTRHRGLNADVIFMDWDAGADDLAFIEELTPCLATSRVGELIRA